MFKRARHIKVRFGSARVCSPAYALIVQIGYCQPSLLTGLFALQPHVESLSVRHARIESMKEILWDSVVERRSGVIRVSHCKNDLNTHHRLDDSGHVAGCLPLWWCRHVAPGCLGSVCREPHSCETLDQTDVTGSRPQRVRLLIRLDHCLTYCYRISKFDPICMEILPVLEKLILCHNNLSLIHI